MRQSLSDHEKEKKRILEQAGTCANSLHAQFRSDIIYSSYGIFKDLGITLDELFSIQKKIPIIYPWNTEYDIYRTNVNRRFNVFPLMIVMAKSNKHVKKAFKW